MTLADWTPLYARLCAGLSRKESPAQSRAYFDAVSEFPASVVADAVVQACSTTWPPTHPHAGELRGLAINIRRARTTVPASACDVCHGDKFTYSTCEGWHSVNGKAEPVNRQQLCRRDFPHAKHKDAHFCPQCHPAARRTEPAA